MEIRILTEQPLHAVREFVGRMKGIPQSDPNASTFSGLPTGVILPPTVQMDSSLHWMVFPPSSKQRFHYHPSSRYLIVLGDVDLKAHYSAASVDQNPHSDSRFCLIPALSLACIRFPGFYWHMFESADMDGLGIAAFSFHGKDDLEALGGTPANMMEELTVFWGEKV